MTAKVTRAASAKGAYPLAMRVRDELGESFADAEFAQEYGTRGRPGLSLGMLALITVLQKEENLTDRAATDRAEFGMGWKYALSLELDDPGLDHSVLSEFRARVAAHGLKEKALDLLPILVQVTDRKLLAEPPGCVSGFRETGLTELTPEQAAEAVEGFDCPTCGVMAPPPCHTRGRKVASKYHTARFVFVPALVVPVSSGRGPGSSWQVAATETGPATPPN
ncbi:transposase [Nonomuraea basaltis]|uniref:transposase n=1 Tax=Nonomuraea basaltis TaxID=2495887 RepID=UPI0014870520|nr:transposase [Nonomuraea basaltis]